MPKSILALDQASRVSGWSFFDNDQLIDFGHWEHTADNLGIRIHGLCEQIQEKINEFNPDLIVIENIQMQEGNVATFQKLAWVQGAIMALAVKNNIPYELVYPSEWRKECNFLKGNDKHRTSQKKIAQEWVKETYGMKCTQDESDAICIGYALSKQNNNRLDWD